LAALLLVMKVVLGVWGNYPRYFPPDFSADFLRGRDSTFTHWYAVAFYVHVTISPVTLLLGLILMSSWFRTSWPAWHRWLGRVQVWIVLLGVVPSGLLMSFHAETGAVAGSGLAILAGCTAWCVWQGWRAVRKHNFQQHEIWMTRTYLLLCSAVVLRMWGGVATLWEWDNAWSYPLACWFSWVGPLLLFEGLRWKANLRR
jgi:uncharacterized membrane protein